MTRSTSLSDDALGGESVEAPLVKDHVRAVIAGVRTADAGGIGELANAAGSFVGVEVDVDRRRGGQRIERLHVAVRIVRAVWPSLFQESPGCSSNDLPLARACADFEQRDLALTADDAIDEGFAQSFVGQAGWDAIRQR